MCIRDSAYSEDGNTDLTEGEWFRGGVGVKAAGVICYEGATTVYPPSDACDVQLWADGVDLGETYDDDTLGSNGEFDTGFYQTPSTSGLDNDYDFKVTLTDFVSGASEGSGGADPDINSARDNQAPTISSPSVSESSDYIYASGTTIYYGDDMSSAQSFTLQGSSSDGSGVGLDKATFPSNELGSPGDDTTPASWSGVYDNVENTDTWTGTITVTVYDKVGNTNTQEFTVNRDTTNPVFSSFTLDSDTDSDGGNDIDPDTGWYDDLTIQGDFSGCSDTGSGIRGYQIRTDTHTWGNEDADGVNVGCTAGGEGTWDINYRIYDNVGNSITGDTTVDVSIDTTPPTLDDAMSGYSESGDTDEMYGDIGTNTFYFSNSFDSDGTATFTCTFTDTNKWKADFGSWGSDDPSEDTSSPYQGSYTVNNLDSSGTINVLVYDKAGNSASGTVTCTEDTTLPDTTAVSYTHLFL
ncbi:MAG TPA: hypothetical protein ENI42_03195 [Thermoplasmatales archaeon]|nr:hypothetical protein [Thermoplasmatales archaeon]